MNFCILHTYHSCIWCVMVEIKLKSRKATYLHLYLIWPSCIYIWSQNVYLDPTLIKTILLWSNNDQQWSLTQNDISRDAVGVSSNSLHYQWFKPLGSGHETDLSHLVTGQLLPELEHAVELVIVLPPVSRFRQQTAV